MGYQLWFVLSIANRRCYVWLGGKPGRAVLGGVGLLGLGRGETDSVGLEIGTSGGERRCRVCLGPCCRDTVLPLLALPTACPLPATARPLALTSDECLPSPEQ